MNISSVKKKNISGRPRSSGRRSGNFSKDRAASYATYPTAPPKNRGNPGTSGALFSRSMRRRSSNGFRASQTRSPRPFRQEIRPPLIRTTWDGSKAAKE